MKVVIVCIVLGYVFGCIVGFIGGRFVQKKDVEKFKSDYHKLCKLKDIRIQKLESEKGNLTDKCKELEIQLTLKITSCIKTHLCKMDEDFDKPIISPKFLSDALDQMAADGFEEIKEK